MAQNKVEISTNGMRATFEGELGPTALVIPLLIRPGKYDRIQLRVNPREGVSLKNEVHIGDGLRYDVQRASSVSIGASCFAEASLTKVWTTSRKAYEVVSTPDFKGVIFRLYDYAVKDEPIGLQLVFPIASYQPDARAQHIASVTLEVDGTAFESICVPTEKHPSAARILVLSSSWDRDYYDHGLVSTLNLPYLETTETMKLSPAQLPAYLRQGFAGMHIFGGVDYDTIRLGGVEMTVSEFFELVNGHGLKLLFFSCCFSVRVISAFRNSDVLALVAATEALGGGYSMYDYAPKFESCFYEALGRGSLASEAFREAAKKSSLTQEIPDRRRTCFTDPMFLDLKTDFSLLPRV